MNFILLLKSFCRKQKSAVGAIFFMALLASLCAFSSVTLFLSGKKSVSQKMDSLGVGDFTIWVNSGDDRALGGWRLHGSGIDADRRNVGEVISTEVLELDGVQNAIPQKLIFSGYEIAGKYSDNEGELLCWSEEFPYKFIDESGKEIPKQVRNDGIGNTRDDAISHPELVSGSHNIGRGEVYISPALKSSFDVSIGSKINFQITATSDGTKTFTVAGFFEDAFMGSSMIDMKSFLICEKDFSEIQNMISAASKSDALAKYGAMIHIKLDEAYKKIHGTKAVREVNRQIESQTRAPLFTAFSYTKDSILSYMILLQNILCGVMFVFSLVLIAAAFIVIAHTLGSSLEQEKKNMAIFKTLGTSSSEIRLACICVFASAFVVGIFIGSIFVPMFSKMLSRALVSSTGLLVEIFIPMGFVILFSLAVILFLVVYLLCGTKTIAEISPVQVFNGEMPRGCPCAEGTVLNNFLLANGCKADVFDFANAKSLKLFGEKSWGRCGGVPRRRGSGKPQVWSEGETSPEKKLTANNFQLTTAFRELLTKKARYIGIFLISILLVVFLGIIGKMTSWLGANGEGLMNAFSVAQHDLGVQPYNADVPMDEIERAINWYSPIVEQYELAMQSVTIEGAATTANVLSDTKYFHILQGSAPNENEILITDTIANELALHIGDSVQVSSRSRTERYEVSGIYACANGMGNNIGMSTEGYSKIGDVSAFIWCVHYIQENGGYRDYEMEFLQQNYSGIDVHTNGWSGLDGIVRLMHTLIFLIYIVAVIFILISAMLTTQKLLQSENKNLAIYKSLGFTNAALRFSFALRFLLTVFVGGVFGTAISIAISNPLVSAIFKTLGIGEFKCGVSFMSAGLPIVAVCVVFVLAAWVFSGKVKRASIVQVIQEGGE